MASLFLACDEIQDSGSYTYTIGNNDITIETFNNDEIQNLLNNNLPIGSTSQENIVLIKDTEITINAGQILAPTDSKKSLVLFCDILTNNGTISMTGKGPNVLPHEYVIIQNDSIFDDVIIPAYAGNRIERRALTAMPYAYDGIMGNNGTNRQCGSGGQGVATSGNSSNLNKRLGASGSGYAFGGGAGAGGKSGADNTTFESNADVDPIYPMRGSPGFSYSWYTASGGVGNPSGAHAPANTYTQYSGHNGIPQTQNTGVGGRVIIFCNTFINNGNIQVNGVNAYSADMYWAASGGSSGGGAIDIFYADSCQQGIIAANGGASGDITGDTSYGITGLGGKGGDGSITISQLSSGIMDYTDKIQEFNYTGKTQAVTLEPGVYEFYCRGAKGGGEPSSFGSSSKARIAISETKTFYVNIGQQALENLGGWNGGTTVGASLFGGGGATDIAIKGVNQSPDWNTEQHLNSRILIAAGGKGEPGAGGRTTLGVPHEVYRTSSTSSLTFYSKDAIGDPIGQVFIGTTKVSEADNNGGGSNFRISLTSDGGPSLILKIGGSGNTEGSCTWRATYANNPLGGNGGGQNYIYTELTKNSYPVSPCNAETYYMIEPVITANDSTAIGDGYAYIKTLKQTLKIPTIIGEYFYNGQAQSPILNNFSEEKMVISNNIKTNAGSYVITIRPLSGYYWEDGTSTVKNLTWVINKANPIVQWPVTNKVLINTPISECIFYDHSGPGTFTWVNSALLSEAPNKLFQVKFTPTDLANYNILYNDILVTTFDININNTYNYTGLEQIITLERGVYEITCAGAQGGGTDGQKGNLAKGLLPVLQTTDYKAIVGENPSSNLGGWSDGIDYENTDGFGGGGSTLFKELNSDLSILQAMGGQGAGEYSRATGTTTGTLTATQFTGTTYYNNNYNVHVLEFYVTGVGSTQTTITGGSYVGNTVPAAVTITVQTTNLPSGIKMRITLNRNSSQWVYTNWKITFPSTYRLRVIPDGRALIRNGALGGGADYFNPIIVSQLITQNTNPGNGYLKIKYMGEILEDPIIQEAHYNGLLQKALFNYNIDSCVVFINNKQANAGTYVVQATPRAGYYWIDATNIQKLYNWIINKINPEVIWPEATLIELGDTISESSLINGIGAGLFTWTDATQKTNMLLPGYEATFTPTDLTNYNILKNIISIEIILPDRLNSNIYKNIFSEEPIDVSVINDFILDTIISVESIKQVNHGFSVNDVVYFDGSLYQKAIAENSERAIVAGVVSKIHNKDIFVLMDSGIIDYNIAIPPTESSFLYLSDKIPGNLVEYGQISNTVYIPVAVYTNNQIIINLQQGSFGDVMVPYETNDIPFETYTQEDLDNIIVLVIGEA